MLKLQLLLIPLLNLICLIFVPPPEAWCYSIDHTENTPLLIRENAPPSSRHMAYTIQDNLNLFSIHDPAAPILLPASDNFIAADTIDSNLPIFSLFRNSSNLSPDPFADLLYANLRIKKILQEYAELQERAKMLLLNSSYQSGTMDLMTETDSKLRNTNPQEVNNRKDDNLSQALRRLLRNLSAGTAARDIGTYGPDDKRPSAGKNKNPIVSFSELQEILNKNSELIPTIPNKTSDAYASSGPLNHQPLAGAASDQSTSRQAAKTAYQSSGEIQLPWILDLPFKLFDFAIAHKLISLMIGLFGLMLLNIIFGGRS